MYCPLESESDSAVSRGQASICCGSEYIYIKAFQVCPSLHTSSSLPQMTSRSGTGEKEKRSPPESETSGSLAEGCESTRNKPPPLESRTSPSCSRTVGFEAWLLVCRLTCLAGQHTNAWRLPRMRGAGAREGGNTWNRGPPTACALFLRLCNAHRRKRRIGHYEYKTHFST